MHDKRIMLTGSKRKILSAAVSTTLMVGTAAFAVAQDVSGTSMFSPCVTATNETVTFAGVEADERGFAVVHQVTDDVVELDANIGYAEITPGMNENVALIL